MPFSPERALTPNLRRQNTMETTWQKGRDCRCTLVPNLWLLLLALVLGGPTQASVTCRHTMTASGPMVYRSCLSACIFSCQHPGRGDPVATMQVEPPGWPKAPSWVPSHRLPVNPSQATGAQEEAGVGTPSTGDQGGPAPPHPIPPHPSPHLFQRHFITCPLLPTTGKPGLVQGWAQA